MAELPDNGLNISRPVAVWNREIKAEPHKLLLGLSKMVVEGVFKDWSDFGGATLDTLDALGLAKKPGELAWLLIYRALMMALAELVKNYQDLFRNPPETEKLEGLAALFEEEMDKAEVVIRQEFFDRPGELPLLKELQAPLTDWLQGLGASEADAAQIVCRLPDYFIFALHETWKKAPQDYAALTQYFDSPFTGATEEVRNWLLYAQHLQRQVSDRMFAEAFGVDKVYVPLRAYYEEKEQEDERRQELEAQRDKVKRIVVDLEDEFRSWLGNPTGEPAVRFLSGGPGSGKSTFAKIFAAKIAKETDIPCLYIPLHRFDATGDLIDAMESYIRRRPFLSRNPLDPKKGEKRLLIIFDGLDELALQGKAASEVAKNFVSEVLDRIQEFNGYDKQCQVIITGRTIAVQSVATKLREAKQISSVLPYFVEEEERKEFHDPDGLLAEDQRQIWWRQYGEAAGKGYAGLPADLARKHLAEITAQPLLNYLVALSYDRKSIEFTDDTTLNQIYADLIKAVYCRQYEEGGRVSSCAGGLEEGKFLRVLEEIALAVWHGDGRTATVSSIREKFTAGGIKRYLEQFQEGAKAGVTRLLTAFYFRQSDNRQDGDPTFEFTHKSFGEYLTALRIIRLLRQMQKQRRRRQEDPDDGWSEKEALQHWTSFCAVTAMDFDLLRFISNEFQAMKQEELLNLQGMIRELLSYTINQGLPFPDQFQSKGFKEHLRLARNAEVALLAVHFFIADLTEQVSRLELETRTDFSNWFSRLRTQGIIHWLACLDLSGYYLMGQDFTNAIFIASCLDNTQLSLSFFAGADLRGVQLKKAGLIEANLQDVNLEGANLKDAFLIKAILRGANLEGTNLEKADLTDANLEEANLTGANLKGANLTSANLRDARLEGTNLEGTNLEGANLKGTILENKDS
ncbi:MAG: pentapeptide repeat-containing protein [Candidatus Electrothrix sp. Rat3]|nr:pentapeptide repeat-containing protein [Candidatus Electrothrix rattekaaiensis]